MIFHKTSKKDVFFSCYFCQFQSYLRLMWKKSFDTESKDLNHFVFAGQFCILEKTPNSLLILKLWHNKFVLFYFVIFCLFASYPPQLWKKSLMSNTEIYFLGLKYNIFLYVIFLSIVCSFYIFLSVQLIESSLLNAWKIQSFIPFK